MRVLPSQFVSAEPDARVDLVVHPPESERLPSRGVLPLGELSEERAGDNVRWEGRLVVLLLERESRLEDEVVDLCLAERAGRGGRLGGEGVEEGDEVGCVGERLV